MAKYQLDLDDEQMHVIGIACHEKSYRICWLLNNLLGLLLKRKNQPYQIWVDEENTSDHIYFEGENAFWKCTLMLIQNKGQSNQHLVPEKKIADYLLVILNPKEAYTEEVLEKLKKQSLILAAFRIDLDSLKSKGNLKF